MSQKKEVKKYYGKTVLVSEVLGNPNNLGKFTWNLYDKLGGKTEVFEAQQLGAKLDSAAKTTLDALKQTTRRITGISSGTGNQTPQAENKGLLGVIDPRNGKIAITDMGTVALSAWNRAISPNEPVRKITDEEAIDFMAKAATAVIEVCGYTVDDLKEFEAKRD